MIDIRDLGKIRREVKEIRDTRGDPIDKNIEELVIGLRCQGIKTNGSCEGHNKSYPYVNVPRQYAGKLCRLLAKQNITKFTRGRYNNNIWVVKPGPSLEVRPENVNLPLEEMQQRAIEFGFFLQDKLR